MSLLEAIILGIIQGATEFLPISSSGHLVVLPAFFNMPQPDLVMIGLVHAGTLLAVIGYFLHDLIAIGRAWLVGIVRRDPFSNDHSRLGWFILLGSVPAGIIGLGSKDFLENQFQSPTAAASGLLITALILIIGERLFKGTKPIEKLNTTDVLSIGFLQVLALLPGISRSGTTITAGLWRGLDRPSAARFSFLVGLPAIAGAGLLSILDIFTDNGTLPIGHYVAAFIAATVTGYLCIALLLNWLRRHSLYPFAIYCAVIGLVYLLFVG